MPITDSEMTIPDSHISIPGFIIQNKHLQKHVAKKCSSVQVTIIDVFCESVEQEKQTLG